MLRRGGGASQSTPVIDPSVPGLVMGTGDLTRISPESPTLGAAKGPGVLQGLAVEGKGGLGVRLWRGVSIRQGSIRRSLHRGALASAFTNTTLPLPLVLRRECAAESVGQLCLPTHQ